MIAHHKKAFNMFIDIRDINIVFLAQAHDPVIKDAKPSTYIQRLHNRMSAFMPPRQSSATPMTSGACFMGSVESAALYPCKRARETALAMQAVDKTKEAYHTLPM